MDIGHSSGQEMRQEVGGGAKTLLIAGNNNMTKAAGGGEAHLLFVCAEKVKVSFAKSSLFSNFSSFDWIQKLSSDRSWAPNWVKGTKQVNGDNV